MRKFIVCLSIAMGLLIGVSIWFSTLGTAIAQGQIINENNSQQAAGQSTEPATTLKTDSGTSTATAASSDATTQQAPAVLEFTRTSTGKVTFKHQDHANRGTCKDCHDPANQLFPQARSKETYKMADMYAGKYCGACHDGQKAFPVKGDCSKCHESE